MNVFQATSLLNHQILFQRRILIFATAVALAMAMPSGRKLSATHAFGKLEGLGNFDSTVGELSALLRVTILCTFASENSAPGAVLTKFFSTCPVPGTNGAFLTKSCLAEVQISCRNRSSDRLYLRPFPNQSIPSAGSALGRSRYQHNVALLLERRDDLIECLCIHLHPLEQDTVWQRSIRSRL